MEAVLMPAADEVTEIQWGEAAPVRFDEEEIDLLAFELWQRASCPEDTPEAEQSWASTAEQAWSRASCL